MKIPWLDALLLLIILIGAMNVWRSGTERARLQPEFDRLKQSAGELTPSDPAKIYVRAIDMPEPLEFAWRVYFPPNYRMYVRHSSGSSSSGSNSEAVNAIVRVRLREVDGAWYAYYRFPFSSGLTSVDSQVADVLKDHPERILVEQLGLQEVKELDANSEFILLKLTVPENAQENGIAKFSSNEKRLGGKPIFGLRVGPPSGQP